MFSLKFLAISLLLQFGRSAQDRTNRFLLPRCWPRACWRDIRSWLSCSQRYKGRTAKMRVQVAWFLPRDVHVGDACQLFLTVCWPSMVNVGLCAHDGHLCLHLPPGFSLCVPICLQICPFPKGIRHHGLWSTLRTSYQFNHISIKPVSKSGHFWGDSRLGLQCLNGEGTQVNPQKQ